MPLGPIATIQAQLDLLRFGPGAIAGPAGSFGWGSSGSPSDFDELIQSAAEKNNLDPELIKAVVRTESNFNPNAISGAGAKGLMQIMDFNSRAMGVTNPFDPAQNIEAGARILSGHINRYGDLPKALAAYNAGGPTVDRYGGIPPFRETQTYVSRVLDALRGYRQQATDTARQA